MTLLVFNELTGCLRPKSRHPERSASRIYHMTESLWRAVEELVLSVAEGTSAMLV